MSNERALPWTWHGCYVLWLETYGDGVRNLVLALQTMVLPTQCFERHCKLSVQAPNSHKMREATTDGLSPASLVLEVGASPQWHKCEHAIVWEWAPCEKWQSCETKACASDHLVAIWWLSSLEKAAAAAGLPQDSLTSRPILGVCTLKASGGLSQRHRVLWGEDLLDCCSGSIFYQWPP